MNNDLPQIVILRTGKREARHAGHVDAVLGDPEPLLRCAHFNDVLEFRRVGMQAFRNFRSSNAWPAMTIRAAVLQKLARTGLNACRVGKVDRQSILGMAVDRRGPNLDQRPFHDGRIFRWKQENACSAFKLKAFSRSKQIRFARLCAVRLRSNSFG